MKTQEAFEALFRMSEFDIEDVSIHFAKAKSGVTCATITAQLSQLLSLFLCEGGRLTEEQRAAITNALPSVSVCKDGALRLYFHS